MSIQKPEWVKQAEEDLEVFKVLPIFNKSAAQIAANSKSYECKICKELFSLTVLKIHEKVCLDQPNRKKNVLELYHSGTKPSNSEIQRLTGYDHLVVKNVLAEEGLLSWDRLLEQELEINVLKLYKLGKTDIEIKTVLGIGNSSLHRILKRSRIKITSNYHKEIQEGEKEILKHYNDGTHPTYRDISERVGKVEQAVRNFLKSQGLENWSTRLKKEEDLVIEALLRTGLTPTQVCNQHGYYFRRVKGIFDKMQ